MNPETFELDEQEREEEIALKEAADKPMQSLQSVLGLGFPHKPTQKEIGKFLNEVYKKERNRTK